MEGFGEALKKARVAKEATLREMRDYTGKSIGYISDIEHDRRRPPNLEAVSKMEDFLGIEDGRLVNLARKIRKKFKPTLSQRLKLNPKLSTVLLRTEQLPDYKIDMLLQTIDELEEKN